MKTYTELSADDAKKLEELTKGVLHFVTNDGKIKEVHIGGLGEFKEIVIKTVDYGNYYVGKIARDKKYKITWKQTMRSGNDEEFSKEFPTENLMKQWVDEKLLSEQRETMKIEELYAD